MKKKLFFLLLTLFILSCTKEKVLKVTTVALDGQIQRLTENRNAYFTGFIKNIGNEVAFYPRIDITLYSDINRSVAIGSARVTSNSFPATSLSPGERFSFKASCFCLNKCMHNQIKSYFGKIEWGNLDGPNGSWEFTN